VIKPCDVAAGGWPTGGLGLGALWHGHLENLRFAPRFDQRRLAASVVMAGEIGGSAAPNRAVRDRIRAAHGLDAGTGRAFCLNATILSDDPTKVFPAGSRAEASAAHEA